MEQSRSAASDLQTDSKAHGCVSCRILPAASRIGVLGCVAAWLGASATELKTDVAGSDSLPTRPVWAARVLDGWDRRYSTPRIPLVDTQNSGECDRATVRAIATNSGDAISSRTKGSPANSRRRMWTAAAPIMSAARA